MSNTLSDNGVKPMPSSSRTNRKRKQDTSNLTWAEETQLLGLALELPAFLTKSAIAISESLI